MPSPPAIVFDLGKVLLDFDYSIAARKIATRARPGLEPARIFSDHASLLVRYETGLVTTADFFQELCAAIGFRGTTDEFGEFFKEIFTPIQPMIDLHAELRRKGFPTYIFSNTNDVQLTHIRRRYPFFSHFDGYILSYEHGAMKPDAKLYEIVERETKRTGAEILYLDDRAENAAAGAARGWQTVVHESPEKTRQVLEALGMFRRNT